jgi:magnesium transporter
MGADYLAYALMDIIVDQYYATLERIGERLDEIEDNIPDSAEQGFIPRVHALRQRIFEVSKAAWPLREVASSLSKEEVSRIDPAVKPYLRDLYDHIVTVLENVEHFRERTTGIRDIYLSSVSIRMNGIMKVLTIISTIFMPLTFITGVYGMNFIHMPELRSRWGYPAVLGVSAVIVLVQLWVFRRRKWF